ncbi:MAG: ATP-binding protein [Paludibacteraceae bacterium]|nr:ATP-binding protein [Paludibacteraceae bacterium]
MTKNFDVNKLTEYQEDNRLEVKKASGGLPHSLWETYSSFANSDGGLIVLGVEEDKNHQLQIVGVPKPDELIRDFWVTINNPQKVSLNILTDSMVSVQTIDDKQIITIEVPRAEREMRPIYCVSV